MAFSVNEKLIEELLNRAATEEHVFWGKELVVSYLLSNGFTVTGRAACVDPSLFDIEKGREIARQDVVNQMWKLEGYRLQVDLSRTSAYVHPRIDSV